jgi:hypothetical protein
MNLTRLERLALDLGAALVTALLAATAAFSLGLTVAPQIFRVMNQHPWAFGAGVLAFTAVTEYLLRRRGR